MEGGGITFNFGEEDLAAELSRFGVTLSRSRGSDHSPELPLSPSAVTWTTLFIGLCADITDARRGTSSADGRLILTNDEFDSALESRAHFAKMPYEEADQLSEQDRQQIRAWLAELKYRAERQGNYAVLSQVFKHGVERSHPAASISRANPHLADAAA